MSLPHPVPRVAARSPCHTFLPVLYSPCFYLFPHFAAWLLPKHCSMCHYSFHPSCLYVISVPHVAIWSCLCSPHPVLLVESSPLIHCSILNPPPTLLPFPKILVFMIYFYPLSWFITSYNLLISMWHSQSPSPIYSPWQSLVCLCSLICVSWVTPQSMSFHNTFSVLMPCITPRDSCSLGCSPGSHYLNCSILVHVFPSWFVSPAHLCHMHHCLNYVLFPMCYTHATF